MMHAFHFACNELRYIKNYILQHKRITTCVVFSSCLDAVEFYMIWVILRINKYITDIQILRETWKRRSTSTKDEII